jgi:hypothetical protein
VLEYINKKRSLGKITKKQTIEQKKRAKRQQKRRREKGTRTKDIQVCICHTAIQV